MAVCHSTLGLLSSSSPCALSLKHCKNNGKSSHKKLCTQDIAVCISFHQLKLMFPITWLTISTFLFFLKKMGKAWPLHAFPQGQRQSTDLSAVQQDNDLQPLSDTGGLIKDKSHPKCLPQTGLLGVNSCVHRTCKLEVACPVLTAHKGRSSI